MMHPFRGTCFRDLARWLPITLSIVFAVVLFESNGKAQEPAGVANPASAMVLPPIASNAAANAPDVANKLKAGGEASLVLPDLGQAKFLGGVSGRVLLYGGLLVSTLGLLFGLQIYGRLKALPVHESMREVSELIYTTCKTYLLKQGLFIALLWVIIASVIVFHFYYLLHFEAFRVGIIVA